jgi:hypothetical protein
VAPQAAVRKDARSYGSTHFALSFATDAAAVQAMAQCAGWQCFDYNRGPFHVIEVWVENETMVETCRPNMQPDGYGNCLAAHLGSIPAFSARDNAAEIARRAAK